MKSVFLAAGAAMLSLSATAASAATPLNITYTGTVSGTNSTYNVPYDVPVSFFGVTTAEDAADGSFSYSSFSTNYSGTVTTVNNATGAFVGNVFRTSIGGVTFADFNFTGGFPNFTTGVNYAVTLSGGAPFTGDFGTAAITGGAGIVRSDLGMTAAVPEPATWAMMLLGFAMIGAAFRATVRKSEMKFTERMAAIATGKMA